MHLKDCAAALPVHAQTTQTVLYVHTDALGSVVAKTDVNGNVVERYDYEPYGAPIGAEVQDGPAYTGHVSDSATGLSYMQQRYYDPVAGRFLSADPVTAMSAPDIAFGRYRYAANNPYKYTDPDGRFERATGSQLSGGQGFSGSRVAIVRSSFRSPMDRTEGGGTPRQNQKISEKVISAHNGGAGGSEAASAVKLVGLIDTARAYGSASDARESAKNSGLGGLGHGKGDAMRHCTWSCQMARDIGPDRSKMIGDNHEIWGTDVPGARQMGLNNNASGRALSTLPGTCSANCTEAARNDQLEVYMGN
ncbi:RHS repeat domain-containing protein [Stenotrophomonas sp. PD6]|uniref:RHS repeat domain-containing protein n=1 Tax=Stenotrophomonas sp. PD6 TaxID=3368612 RepID=UPI003BA1854B